MSRAGSHVSRKSAPHHHRRRGKRRPGGARPAVAIGQRHVPQKSISLGTAPPPSETRPRVPKIVPDLAYVRRDLIRVGLVSGVTVLVLVILWLVL